MLTCTKRYTDFPFAHRAPNHEGHCRLIHGHNWTFDITFSASETDANGFVMDFGKLRPLKEKLDGLFDHTLVLNSTDPMLQDFKEFVELLGIENIVEVPDCSCEGIAKLVYQIATAVTVKISEKRVRVRHVVVYEDSKNSACYAPVVPVT